MRTVFRDRRGMTLIEALVAGVIGVIVAGVIGVIYLMYDTQFRESNSGFALQMRYGNVSAQIASYARGAHKILDAAETFADSCRSSAVTCSKVIFYAAAGAPFAGIGTSNDTLFECEANLVWKPYTIGADPVLVDPASSFTLNGCRNELTIDLRVKRTEGDTVFYSDPIREVFRCRN
ncbi:MAG: prepilin-type N-terminal cleavage/methylation domain-containing protein [Chitinispirillaceae bacterium]|nr:prepilin-type N-terminal cleavage/methylation domain-containing protein [Chitinispirillaceae bacterium]